MLLELIKALLRIGLWEFLKKVGWKAALGLILVAVVAVVLLVVLLILLVQLII